MSSLSAWRALSLALSRARAICARPEGLIRLSDRFSSPSTTPSIALGLMRPPIPGIRRPSTCNFGTWPAQGSREGKRPAQGSSAGKRPAQGSSEGKMPAQGQVLRPGPQGFSHPKNRQEPEPVLRPAVILPLELDQTLQPDIRTEMGFFRSYTPRGRKLGLRLPVVTQTSFVSNGDIPLVKWESLPEYLSRVNSVIPVVNPLIPESKLDKKRNHMLSEGCRRLWSSVMDLIIANKARGYCIAKSLTAENLLVSTLYGTVALKCPIAEDLPVKPFEFQGFKAVAHLFIQMVHHTHGPGILGQLTIDVDHWLSILTDSGENDGVVANYHPAMLSAEERAWLCVKFFMVLRNYAYNCHSLAPQTLVQPRDFKTFGYTIEELDSKHEFFQEWRRFSKKFAEKMRPAQPEQIQEHLEDPEDPAKLPQLTEDKENHPQAPENQPRAPEDPAKSPQLPEDPENHPQAPENQPRAPEDPDKAKVEGGQWAVALHRHSVVHSHTDKLSKICGGKRYTPTDVVELMHYEVPMYLPRGVKRWKNNLRKYFDIDRCRPKVPVFPLIPVIRKV